MLPPHAAQIQGATRILCLGVGNVCRGCLHASCVLPPVSTAHTRAGHGREHSWTWVTFMAANSRPLNAWTWQLVCWRAAGQTVTAHPWCDAHPTHTCTSDTLKMSGRTRGRHAPTSRRANGGGDRNTVRWGGKSQRGVSECNMRPNSNLTKHAPPTPSGCQR